MIVFDGVSITGRAQKRVFSGIDARNCIFDGCHLPSAARSGDWNKIRDVSLTNVSQSNCSIKTSVIEDVSLHNLKRAGNGPLFLWGCVFKRVKLSGRISAIKLNRDITPGKTDKHWDDATLDYYKQVDWAIDISEAKFPGSVSLEAIPGDLVKRNPETQVLVKREKLVSCEWRSLDYDNTSIDIALSWFLRDSLFDSVVIPACGDTKTMKREVTVLNMLRSEGVAEYD